MGWPCESKQSRCVQYCGSLESLFQISNAIGEVGEVDGKKAIGFLDANFAADQQVLPLNWLNYKE